MMDALSIHPYDDVVQASYDLAYFLAKARMPGSLNIINKVQISAKKLDMQSIQAQCNLLLAEMLRLQDKCSEAKDTLTMAYRISTDK